MVIKLCKIYLIQIFRVELRGISEYDINMFGWKKYKCVNSEIKKRLWRNLKKIKLDVII